MTQSVQPTLEQIRSHALACLAALVEDVSCGTPTTARWDAVRHALEALPTTTEEASVMRNRLRNAQVYLETDERGAARYELRLLSSRLARLWWDLDDE